MSRIVIVGAGWYGCYLAYLCKIKNIDYIVYEKSSGIFNKSSSHNQNRLHLGYHYPRDYKTRIDSKAGFKKFINSFPKLSTEIKTNIYSVHKDSLIDFQTYVNIYRYEGYDFEIFNEKFSDNYQGSIIVNERHIDHNTSKLFFENAKLNIEFNSNVNYKNGQYFLNSRLISETVYNCTYGGIETEASQKNYFKQNFISFVIKKTSDKLSFNALTVMDGPFYSIFPFEKKLNLYTLTHVNHGVVSKKMNTKQINNLYKLIIAEIKIDLPNFEKHFEFHSYFFSNKYKPISNSDLRSTVIYKESNSFTICGGKIDTIFLLDNLVDKKYLKLK